MKKITAAGAFGVFLVGLSIFLLFIGIISLNLPHIPLNTQIFAVSVIYASVLLFLSIFPLAIGVRNKRRYNSVIAAAYANGKVPIDMICQELNHSPKKVRSILYEAIMKGHLNGIVKDGIYHDLRIMAYIDTRAITRSELASNYV